MRKTKQEIELRIQKLSIKPVENEKIIKKWQRILAKENSES